MHSAPTVLEVTRPWPSTIAFLDALFADVPAELVLGFVAVEAGARWGDPECYAFECFTPAELDAAGAWCASWGPPRNVYVRCMPMWRRPARRGEDTDSTALVGVWSDVDYHAPGHKQTRELPLPPRLIDAERVIDDVAIPPTLVIGTGGGLQAWWLLDAPLVATTDTERAELGAIVRRWGESMVTHGRARKWHVDSVNDRSRVLRVPGTWRTKIHDGRPLDPLYVTLHDVGEWPPSIYQQRPWRPGPRYSIDEITTAMLAPVAATLTPTARASSTARSPSTARSSTVSSFGPADAFNALEWRHIFEPTGWTFVGHEHDAELWRRPGNPSSPYSAKAFEHNVVVWSDAAGLPTGAGQKLTKFRLWCLLHRITENEGARIIRQEYNRRRARP